MNGIEPGMPPFGVMARALQVTTQRLACEIAAPSATAPNWSPLEWSVARAVSSMQGCSGVLAALPQWPAAQAWRVFLEEQREQIAAIQQRAATLLGQLDAAARREGVACVALKGAALMALGLHAPGVRPMGDIDVLVHPADADAMQRVLHGLGYHVGQRARRHVTYYPPDSGRPPIIGEHRDNPLRIEVHTHVSEALPLSEVDITATLWPAAPTPGINAYPGLAALLGHLLIHAAGNMRARALRMVQLYDIATLARRLQEQDWRELITPGRAGGTWWMYPSLALSNRYLPGMIPTHVLAATRAACPPRLRRCVDSQLLYDVSWSNLSVEAFPGIEWARSRIEALRYARSRAFPSSVALQELAEGARSLPGLHSVPWYQLSHARRIARWLFSRPPRVQTVVCLRAALASRVS